MRAKSNMSTKSNKRDSKSSGCGPEIHVIPVDPTFAIPLKPGMRLFNSFGDQVVVVEFEHRFFYVESDGNFYKFKGSEEFIAYADFTEENFNGDDSILTFSLPEQKWEIVRTLVAIREKVATYMLTTFSEELTKAVDSNPDSTPADEALLVTFKRHACDRYAKYPLSAIAREIISPKPYSQGTYNTAKKLIADAIKYEQDLLESAGLSEVKGF